MKTKLIIILFTSLLGCDQCDHDPPLTELEKLPPATQEGKNTFGCLVNGKAWVTKTSIDAAAFYQGGLLSISADRVDSDETIRLRIGEKNGPIFSNQTYSFDDPSVAVAEFYRALPHFQCDYSFNHLISGRLILTKLDRVKLIVSGEFDFSSALNECDTIQITNGRFDLTYAN